MTKIVKRKRGLMPTRRVVPDVPGRMLEDLTKSMREDGAKVRMRIVMEVDVAEDEFNRDAFNEAVVDGCRAFDGDLGRVVLLTTEEVIAS